MKKYKILLAAAFMLPAIMLRAQEAEQSMFLFDDFQTATVILRNGRAAAATLNYNTSSGTFYVKADEETAMELSDTSTIAAVRTGDRYFENAGKSFYEKITLEGDAVLYVDWRTDVFEKGKKGAYGSTSNLSNIKSVSETSIGGKRINLKEAVEYSARANNGYYVRNGNSFKQLKSMKALKKMLKGHETELDRYAAENKPDFGKLDDMKNLVTFITPYLK